MSPRLKAYVGLMRLNRPWPILLIVFPTLWGLFLGHNLPSFRIVMVFLLGSFITRSAGCVINDYFDREIDGKIKRTEKRPLQLQVIKNREAVYLFLGLMALAACLLFFLHWQVVLLAIPAFLLALGYPLAKRYTYFPQVVLGIAFNFGLIMAVMQVDGRISMLAWTYYVLAVLWTVHYDTLYALSDYQDDLTVGVKSIATFFKDRVYCFLLITAIFCLGLIATLWHLTGFSEMRIILFSLLVLFFIYQHIQLLSQKEAVGLKLFKQHVWVGLLVWLGVLF